MISSSLPRIAAAPAWYAGLWRLVVGAGRAVQRARHRRAVHAALLELDERTLRDLGLHRSELPSLMNGPDATRRRLEA